MRWLFAATWIHADQKIGVELRLERVDLGMLGRLAELVFPLTCFGCGRRGVGLCDGCRTELPYLPREVCARCAGWRSASGTCRGCRSLTPALGSVRAALAYEGAARTAVAALKFRGGRCLAPVMGELLRDALRARPMDADLVVPVPLARARLRERGFNQAALLAADVTQALGARLEAEALQRLERRSQHTLSGAARRTNLRGAIIVRPQSAARVRGQRILLIDDVVTTGATLSACADALAAAGAERISALAFARDL